MSQARRPKPSTDLRHDPARRRAVARHLAEHAGEARDRPAAGAARGRRDRGGLPDHLTRRLRGRADDLAHRGGPDHRRPGAHPRRRHRRGLERGQGRRAAADPHVHLDVRHPHPVPAPDHARGRQGPGARGGRARQAVRRRRRVLADGRDPRRHRVHRRGVPDRDRRGRDHDQHPRHRRLHDAARVHGVPGAAVRAGPGSARRRAVGPLPRRPGAGRRQLVRRPAGRRAAGRVRDQRDRRARRQRVARGDRDAAAHALERTSACTPAWSRARSPAPRGWSRG